MEPDEDGIFAESLHATAAEWRAGAKVCMEKVPEADDADAAELKASAKDYIKIAELLEVTGAKCLAELPTWH